jgi:2-aminobenzoate-CoA ligase
MADTPFAPGDGRSAHLDSFARDNLPPPELVAEVDFSTVPELAAYPDRMNAAVELLDSHVTAGRGDRRLFHFEGADWSYSDLKDRSERIARVLVDKLGLVPGNRVLLRGPNNPMLAACWFAVLKAGGICVATMPLLRGRELAYIAERAQIKHALCDIRFRDEMENARERASVLEHLSYFTATGGAADSDADLDRAMDSAEGGFETVDTAADDVALIAFTSGTTGSPKGAIHFHRDVLAMCDTFARHVFKGQPDEIYTGSPPLAFTFGLGALLCFPMRFGSSIAFVERPSPDVLLKTIASQRCTALYTAPTMYRALLERISEFDVSSLTKCVSAGETLPLPTFEAWRKATGLRIIDGLGSTEMIHIFVSAAGDDIRPGATGKAIPGYQARVVDEAGNPVQSGEIGNLAVRGPTACKYLDNVERQKAYVKNGWNLPGDIYRMDEDGYLWYQARADDMIISAGYNISGPEVEDVLLDHPKVRECAVVAAPDPERGHVVKAFVVLRESGQAGPETAKELQDYVKSEIAPYKYPRRIEFVDDLPRTETGKLQRFRLREAEEARARPMTDGGQSVQP